MRWQANTLVLLVLTVSASACTQWGTSPLRTVDVWWACLYRHKPCSSDNAALTLIQMDNTFRAVRVDVERYERYGSGKKQETAEVEEVKLSLALAYRARARVSNASPVWNDDLADYVLYVVRAERQSKKLL